MECRPSRAGLRPRRHVCHDYAYMRAVVDRCFANMQMEYGIVSSVRVEGEQSWPVPHSAYQLFLLLSFRSPYGTQSEVYKIIIMPA